MPRKRKINLPGMRLPSEMRTRNKQLVRFKGRVEYEAMQGAADELGITQNEFCLIAIAEKVKKASGRQLGYSM